MTVSLQSQNRPRGWVCKTGSGMRKVALVVAVIAPLLSGCADLATGLASYADELNAQNGDYFEDEHYSQAIEGDCPSYWEYGRASNRAYQRVRNLGETYGSYTLTWSSGYETTLGLAPGATSEFFYMTPSVTPEHVDVEC